MSCDGLKTKPWRFTGFYGEPRMVLRKNSWYLLRFFRKQLDLPWLCAGDFNEVLLPEEHFGASERESWQIAGFQELVVDCEFVDLGYSGLPYTWDNWQAGAHNVKTRLDRVFGDHRFLDAMGESAVKILPTVFSDHATVLIEVRVQMVTRGWRRKKKTFRYEHMWQRHDGYEEFVNQAWKTAPTGNLLYVAASLSGVQTALTTWNDEAFGSVGKKLRVIRAELERERNHMLYRGLTERERSLMRKLAEILAREEEMERQRSRMEWLKSDDRNTGFFQAKAKSRARTNRIRALRRADGSEESDQAGLEQMVSDFYQGLFAA
jgi:hypothetical protein